MFAPQPDVADDLTRRVLEALDTAGVGYGLTPIVGPRRVTFDIRPDAPGDVALLKRVNLRWHLDTDDVEVEESRGGLLVSVPNPRPGWLPVSRLGGRAWSIPIGLDRLNQPVGFDMLVNRQGLIVGSPNTGKTNLARVIAYGIARQLDPADARLVVITGDPADWRGVEQFPHCAAVVLHRQAPAVLRAVRDEVARREETGEREPSIVVFGDDMGVLFEEDADLGRVMLALVKQGRRVGIKCVFAAHTAGKVDLGHHDIGQIITRRFQTQTGTAWAAAMGTGRSKTEATTLTLGEVVSVGDASRPTPHAVTVARCEPADLVALAQRLARKYADFQAPPLPWLDATGSNRVQPGPTVATAPNRPPHLAVVRPPTPSPQPPVATVVPVVQRLPRREPTAEDLAVVRANFDLCGQSKTRTCKATWGGKDGDTWRWLHSALEDAS